MKMTSKRNIYYIGAAAVALVLFLLFAYLAVSTSPAGKWKDDEIGSIGVAYWQFKNHSVELVTEDSRVLQGVFFKTNHNWVMVMSNGNEAFLEPSFLELHIRDVRNGKEELRLKRLFFKPSKVTTIQ